MRYFALLVCSPWILPIACFDPGAPGTSGVTTGGSGDTSTGTTGSGTATTAPSEGSSSDESGGSTSSGSSSSGGDTLDTSGGVTTAGDTGNVSECESPDDCTIVNDCCTCDVLNPGEPIPPCGIPECFVDACGSMGITAIADCVFGSCELAKVACDPTQVLCDSLPPKCAEGFAPSVVGGCWGPCVAVHLCDVVPDCSACPRDEACVTKVTQLGLLHSCSPIPETCGGTPTCECLPGICEAPFDSCSDDGGISCSCPVC